MSAAKKILVVDDDEAIQSVLKTLLEMEGYDVSIAADGQVALDMILKEKTSLDLILLDLHMPNMTGWQFAEAVRSQGTEAQKKIPVVITSATNKASEKESFNEFSAFLRKPFNLEELIEICRRFCYGEKK